MESTEKLVCSSLVRLPCQEAVKVQVDGYVSSLSEGDCLADGYVSS